MRFALAVILISLIGPAGFAIEGQLAPTEQIFSTVIAENPKTDILLVADLNHSNLNIWKAFALALPALKNGSPNLDCVMLELDQRAQTAFDKFLKNPKPNSLKGEIKKVSGLAGAIDDERLHVTEGILYQAHVNHLKVIAADIDFSSEFGKRLINETLTAQFFPDNVENSKSLAHDVQNVRNQIFAQRASDLLHNHICKQIVQLIGAAHLSPSLAGIPVEALTTTLAKKRLAFIQSIIWPLKCDEDTKSKAECEQSKKLFLEKSYAAPYDVKESGGVSFMILAP